MKYRVTAQSGDFVEVEAFDWMMAMVQAIEKMGIQVSGWVCETRFDGSVRVIDPVTGRAWEVTKGGVAPAIAPRSVPPVPKTDLRPKRRTRAPTVPPAQPRGVASVAPAPRRPTSSAPEADLGPPDDLAERLFDMSMELSSSVDGNDAGRKALNLCLQVVPCEAGSVLRGGLNQANLVFVAVAGPVANALLGQELPFGEGLVGASFDLGITIQVDDVRSDARHHAKFDEGSGFQTKAVLCVPVQGRNQYHGAIQLLNPTGGRFMSWHRDVVEQLASSLASTLDGLD